MNLSTPFIRRPVATTLLTFGLALAGVVAFFQLPVSPLPQVDFPTISVQATLPGASPEDVATSVATPLERHLGQIADVTEMTSSSTVGSTRITLQFGLNRDIDGAARDVQAAINAARADLPTSLRSNPTYRKVNPADAPILILALTSDTLTRGADLRRRLDRARAEAVAGRRHRPGRGQRQLAARGARRAQSRRRSTNTASVSKTCAPRSPAPTPTARRAASRTATGATRSTPTTRPPRPPTTSPLIVAYRNGAAVRSADVGEVTDGVENLRNAGLANGKPAVLVILYRQPGANIIETVDRGEGAAAAACGRRSRPRSTSTSAVDRTTTIRASLRDVERTLVIAVVLVILVVFVFLRNAARDA